MATLEENLRKIRGEAIYGKDVRAAIAEGIEQMDDQIAGTINSYISRIASVENDVNNRNLYINTTNIVDNDYKLTVVNAT